MPVRNKTHEALKDKYAKLQHDYAYQQESLAAHQEVVKERDKAGHLLLDCLIWMQAVNVTTKQKGGSALIAERESLMKRAKELGWLPGRTEEEQEEVGHGH